MPRKGIEVFAVARHPIARPNHHFLKTVKPLGILLLTATLATTLHADDLLPELRALVLKRETDLAALATRQEAPLARVRQPYLTALVTAENTATRAGQISVIAAVTRERSALAAGILAPQMPNDLPKDLQGTRKAFIEAQAKLATEGAAQRQRLDADHLRALAALQVSAASNPELTKQISAEKAAILGTDAGGFVGGEWEESTSKLVMHRVVLPNGKLELLSAEGKESINPATGKNWWATNYWKLEAGKLELYNSKGTIWEQWTLLPNGDVRTKRIPSGTEEILRRATKAWHPKNARH